MELQSMANLEKQEREEEAVANPQVDKKMEELRKELGLTGGISIIVGCIVGSGIFVSPKEVLAATGSVGLTLCVWVGAGLISLLGALCYCELGTMIPKSGGEYSYIRAAFGDLPAFLCIWVSVILIRPSSLAVMSLTFGTYFSSLFSYCGQPEVVTKLAAASCLVTIMVLNCYSTRMAANIQIITTTAKVAALIVIIIGGIVKMTQGNTKEITSGFMGSSTEPSTIALAFYDALWAYDGWNNLNYVTEELRHPSKNLPRAIVISMVGVIIIYALTNLAYLSVMTRVELLDANAVAVLWGDRVLLSAATIIPVSVMVSTFGSCNGTAFSGSRSVFSAARDGNFPHVFSYINVHQVTPLPSMVFTILIAIIFITLGEISSLINFFSFTAWVFYGITFASLLYFRYKHRDNPRPYKVPTVIPIVMVLISCYLIIAPIIKNPTIEFLYATIFILGGSIFYFPFVHFKHQLPFFEKFTTYVQLILEVAPAKKFD